MKLRITLVLACADDTKAADFARAKAAVAHALESKGFAVKDTKLAIIDPDVEDVSDEDPR